MTDKSPIILTEKQREALIHCTRLRRGLKTRIEQAEPGTQVILFTRKELDEFQDEVGQAALYAVSWNALASESERRLARRRSSN